MDNSDATQGHAMTPQEFAKLMGAYPQPAENPLPAYGGYMDNSPANFSFVEFNDYFGAEEDSKEFTFLYHVYDKKTGEHIEESEVKVTASNEYEARGEALRMLEEGGLDDEEFELVAETFESPYAGAGSLFSIGQNTGLEGFTTSELTTSSAIHGDFDEASLNYSGHQNFEVRAEGDLQGYSEGQYPNDDYINTDTRKGGFIPLLRVRLKSCKKEKIGKMKP